MTERMKRQLFSLIEKYAEPNSPLSLSTSIQKDLELTGDEAFLLIQQISKEFQLDLSMIGRRYFEDELSASVGFSLNILAPAIWAMMYVTDKGKKTELFVGDFLRAIQVGRWEEPNRAPKFPWQKTPDHEKTFE